MPDTATQSIPAETVSELYHRTLAERGYSADDSQLAAVARLHGGELTLADNQPGLKAVIALPRGGPVQSGG